MSGCSFTDCLNEPQPGNKSGLCNSHRNQLYRTGKTWPIKYRKKTSTRQESCSFDGCSSEMSTYTDLCSAHYNQRRKGQPLTKTRHYSDIKSLSDLLSWTTEEGGCLRFRDSQSYSRVGFAKKQWKTHRLSYHLATGESIDGIAIHHKCANTWCVAPWHLQPATSYDNNLEMLARKSYVAQIAALEARVNELEAQLEAAELVIR